MSERGGIDLFYLIVLNVEKEVNGKFSISDFEGTTNRTWRSTLVGSGGRGREPKRPRWKKR